MGDDSDSFQRLIDLVPGLKAGMFLEDVNNLVIDEITRLRSEITNRDLALQYMANSMSGSNVNEDQVDD